MNKNALDQDAQHQFTGVTVKIASVSNVKSEVDGGEIFIKIKCHEKSVSTRKKNNDKAFIRIDQEFFYNTTQILDDDIVFQLYSFQGQSASKNNVSSKLFNSKSKVQYQGKKLGETKEIQVSRLHRQKQQKVHEFLSAENKVVGKIEVIYEYFERQDVIGGIKCPNLSLKPNQSIKGSLTLENKYANSKNLYSFLDGNDTPYCEFFPKKFQH